ncbi:hypothetical protein [Microbulbifer aggregans]|uniref:hypothetical protein n=1 Tax=Microbulbifer aggregans TaxID=1769779 RepID=UPI001CFF15BF|nr:hypothetical protein [Microbulbifer aggregans]
MGKVSQFLAVSGFLSFCLFLRWESHVSKSYYLDSLAKIEAEDIHSIYIGEYELPREMHRGFHRCLVDIRPGLIRGGREAVSLRIELKGGGELLTDLVLLHKSRTIVWGYGKNYYVWPKKNVHSVYSSFTGISTCLYDYIYG